MNRLILILCTLNDFYFLSNKMAKKYFGMAIDRGPCTPNPSLGAPVNSNTEIIITTRSRQQNHEDNKDEAEYEMSEDEYYENQGIIAQSSEYPDSGESEDSAYQLYLRPDLTPALISIINFYEWPRVYYIYNYQQAVANMEKLLEYQNSDPAFLQRILIRRVSDIHNCRDMLRAIEASNENSVNNREKITMMVDLDSKESYMAFLNQIKDLGMTKVKYYYVLATLVRVSA